MFARAAGTLTSVRWCHTRQRDPGPRAPASHVVGDLFPGGSRGAAVAVLGKGWWGTVPAQRERLTKRSRVHAKSRSCWQQELGKTGELALESP